MSSPVYDPEDHEGHLRYAPKSVRDSNFQNSPGIVEGRFGGGALRLLALPLRWPQQERRFY